MLKLDDVIKNLSEERSSRSLTSLYGEESSVGKGVNKGADGKAGGKQAKQHQQQQQQQKKKQQQQQGQNQKQGKPVASDGPVDTGAGRADAGAKEPLPAAAGAAS